MAALCNRAGHYIFALWFLSSVFYLSIFFFSSPNLSGRRLDVYHTLTHGVALVTPTRMIDVSENDRSHCSGSDCIQHHGEVDIELSGLFIYVHCNALERI